ncbi:DNA repair protein RecN [Ureibacillus manganicus]|uniref:DNA repair protein RecN n=1 Tax=Ureibacillus manganicus DSM 26584 TaxID=1384049 RepID=A0A0A3I4F5_9BACL|nr:DNA repair protein RecN [Ureibacillus manganicus]KGR78385.1 DNA recombination protein RecN [Ureibacillus manganicus DSM 26584]
MLRELNIRNFAIIDDLTVSFFEGLTVLTGETGAGKSIIIDAVHQLAGGRASHEFIRHGARKAELSGLFQITNNHHAICEKLQDVGIEIEEDSVILQREISEKGKSICRINGKLVPLSILREIGSKLVDIHGQHENQELMDEKQHIHLLDYFASNDISSIKDKYTKSYHDYRNLYKEIVQLSNDEKRSIQKIDLYQFQIKEIEEAKLKIGEEDELLDERRRLSNFHKIFERANIAYDAISGEMNGLDLIGKSMGALDDIAEIDVQFKEIHEIVASSFYSLQDASYQIKSILDDLEFNPERLNEVEHRLTQYQTLKRKYGSTVEEILTYLEKIKEELDQLVNRDENIRLLEQKLHNLEQELEEYALQLTAVRKTSAGKLSEAIMEQLRDLHMEKAKFIVNFDTLKQFDVNGKDQITFYISTNVGEPPKSLPKIASGGELSRIMLALKTIFSSTEGVTSIIFDEVDTGVSGRVAQAIAEKISAVSYHSQVLCITHLPQVAAMADQHYLIRKEVEDNRTFTTVSNITIEERAEEISRMMSGAEITDLTLQHAKELLNLADERKKETKVKI